jgi:trans-aconitate 2-methyltransferase
VTSAWDAEHYLRFADERTRPAADLAGRVAIDAPARVIDLGCGPGNSTRVLAERWPGAALTGLDSSAEMIASARQTDVAAEWVLGDLGEWEAEVPYDVVFSNAALQWLPDHDVLVPRLFAQVAVGGALAFQLPADRYALVRRLIDEVADDAAWRERMTAPRTRLTIEPLERYYDALVGLASRLDLWMTEYQHVMAGAEAIVDWIASTGLRPYLDALADEAERERFRTLLLERVARGYERRADGRVLFGFRRQFVIAYR